MSKMQLSRRALLSGFAIGSAALAIRPAQAQITRTSVRVVYAALDGPPLDMYLDGEKRLSSLPYRTVSPYVDHEPGALRVLFAPQGATPTNSNAIEATVPGVPGLAYSVAVSGRFSTGSVSTQVFADDLTPPPAGMAKLRFIHLSPTAGPAGIALRPEQPVDFGIVRFEESSAYLAVAQDTYHPAVQPLLRYAAPPPRLLLPGPFADRPPGTQVDITEQGWSLSAGAIYSLILIGAPLGEPAWELLAATDYFLPPAAPVNLAGEIARILGRAAG